MPPNDGMRIVIGMSTRPRVRSASSRRGRRSARAPGRRTRRTASRPRGASPANASPTAAPDDRRPRRSACRTRAVRRTPSAARRSRGTRRRHGRRPRRTPARAASSRERVAQRRVERAARWSTRSPSASARFRSNVAGGSAYVQSNIHSTGGAGGRDHARADLERERLGLGLAGGEVRLVRVARPRAATCGTARSDRTRAPPRPRPRRGSVVRRRRWSARRSGTSAPRSASARRRRAPARPPRFVAAYTASTSLPSTRTPGNP